MAQVAEVGGLDADEELLTRFQAQLPHLQRRVGKVEDGGGFGQLGDRAGARLPFADRVLEPHPADAVVVDDAAGRRQAGPRRNRRADAVQPDGHLRRLIGHRHQRHADRLAALDPVRVGQRKQQRRVFHQRPERIGEAAMVGRQVALTEHPHGQGAILDDAAHLHRNEFLVGLGGPHRHPAAHGDLHHAGHRQRRLPAPDVGGQFAVERHLRDGGAIDRLNPQIAHAIVAADHVEADVGQDAPERVGVFLVGVGAAGDAAAVHRGPAAAAALDAVADFDRRRHARHTGIGPHHNFQVGAAGHLSHAAGKSLDGQTAWSAAKARPTGPTPGGPKRQNRRETESQRTPR